MNQFQALIDRIGGTRRAAALGIGLVAAVLILGVSRMATAPSYVPAFTGIPIEQTGKLTEKLTSAGIAHRLEAGGTQVLVAESDLARARVAVAAAGGVGGTRPGMELFDQPTWGMTDFTQQITYRRALEGEMERTIGGMSGIEAAQVHLTLPARSTLRRPTGERAEASVVLKLRNGSTPAADVVNGIAHLVAASVDGLKADDVTILSEEGRLLSIPNDDATGMGLTSRQHQMQREVEKDLTEKVTQLLGPVVGTGNARVQITAQLNFDRVERTSQLVDPDRQVVAGEQKAEIIPGAQGGAGSTNIAKTYENSRAVENYYGATGGVRRLTVAIIVNELTTYDSATKTTAPVRRAETELATIRQLVANAVGADSARGDDISVVSMPFSGIVKPEPEPPPTLWDQVRDNQRLILNGVGLLLAVIVTLMSLRFVQRKTVPAPQYPVPGAVAYAGAAGAASPSAALGTAPMGGGGSGPGDELPAPLDGQAPTAPGVAHESRPAPRVTPKPLTPPPILGGARDTIASQIMNNPEMATRLIRAWLRDG